MCEFTILILEPVKVKVELRFIRTETTSDLDFVQIFKLPNKTFGKCVNYDKGLLKSTQIHPENRHGSGMVQMNG